MSDSAPAARDDLDRVLVAKANAGDRSALEELLRAHQPRLGALCLRLCGNEGDAADACQEALVAIVRGLASFDGRARFTTWSYRIATNASIDELRRRARRATPMDDDALHGRVDADGSRTTVGSRPGRSASDSATHLDLARALQRLPVEFRAPIVLRDMCGLDYAEIAEILGVPGGTVRSRISRGRGALAPHLAMVDQPGNRHDPSDRHT